MRAAGVWKARECGPAAAHYAASARPGAQPPTPPRREPSRPCRFDRFRNYPCCEIVARKGRGPCHFNRLLNQAPPSFDSTSVGEPCHFDRLLNQCGRFRPVARHFTSEPSEKTGFALQRPSAEKRLTGLRARKFPRPPRYVPPILARRGLDRLGVVSRPMT